MCCKEKETSALAARTRSPRLTLGGETSRTWEPQPNDLRAAFTIGACPQRFNRSLRHSACGSDFKLCSL